MAAKMTARREAAKAGRSRVRGLPAEPLNGMIAWRVNDVNGIENVIYTLSNVPPSNEARRVFEN
jgi:hypothetical protein